MESKIDFDKVRETAIDIAETFTAASTKNAIHLIESKRDELDGIYQIAMFILDRIEATFLLAKSDKLWDAEIIFRTVLEVFMKFLFIIRQKTTEDTKEKLEEYWIKLSDIEMLKHSHEATQLINSKSITSPDRFQHMILSDDEKALINETYPKNERTRLEQNWSFSVLHRKVMEDNDMKKLLSIETIHFFWKMSSHLAHGHKFGVNSIIGRYSIKELKPYGDSSQLIKLAKACTLVSIWIYLEIAEKIANNFAYNQALEMSDEFNLYMQNNYDKLLNESNEAEDNYLRNKTNQL